MIDRPVLHRLYEISTLGKQFDDKVEEVVRSGAARTNWFSWRGSELLGAVCGLSLGPDDYLVVYYRETVAQIAKGSSPKELFAEALGKTGGLHKGKSGFLHMADLDAGVVMNSGIIAEQLPVAAGWALSSTLRGDDKVTLCTFGDGGANEGAFHEALTLASLWKLPVVYVCHNNLYAEHTAFAKMSPVAHVADRAGAYNIPGVLVDSADVVATWNAVTTAIDRARNGDGPTLIEALTSRLRGHTRADAMEYAPEGEVAANWEADPVVRFRAWLISEGHASEDELADLDKKAHEDVEEAWHFANESPYPSTDELYADVFAQVGGVR